MGLAQLGDHLGAEDTRVTGQTQNSDTVTVVTGLEQEPAIGDIFELAVFGDGIDQFAAEMDDFAQCIINDRESRVSGEEGLRDLIAIEAIYRSISTGGTVRLG